MICGQRVILTNGNLAADLSSLPEKKREIMIQWFQNLIKHLNEVI
jgi:hypothetical protein